MYVEGDILGTIRGSSGFKAGVVVAFRSKMSDMTLTYLFVYLSLLRHTMITKMCSNRIY